MRFLLAICGLLCSVFAQTPSSGPDAAATLQSAVTAQFGSQAVQDVQLTGTVVAHFGKDQSGTVSLYADSSGKTQVTFNLEGGSRSEASGAYSDSPACTWTDPDSKVHSVPVHNCWTSAPWFFPVLSTPEAVAQGKRDLKLVGIDQSELELSQTVPNQNPEMVALIRRLSTQTLFLDPVTHLPSKLAFFIHPDNNLDLDIPVEIAFSDYRDVGGVQVPFHIVKTLNGNAVLEISIESAKFNTGSASVPAGVTQ